MLVFKDVNYNFQMLHKIQNNITIIENNIKLIKQEKKDKNSVSKIR